ncbi:MAG: hypothetical protein HC847_09650 [Hydrococcus sp. RU_2_2]|nr:hypothetical protein [Hydrococcus sp. RU_2_2]NJP20833.1 hypothetical protein [Hydrococcus sp. CRU_1_1]NJQ96798.1 hypothetical protein [Hydrococcus sp. CSU_1_8]
MKTKPVANFFVPANEPKTVFVEFAPDTAAKAVICESEREAGFICYLLNEVINGKVFPGPIANEPERGGQE